MASTEDVVSTTTSTEADESRATEGSADSSDRVKTGEKERVFTDPLYLLLVVLRLLVGLVLPAFFKGEYTPEQESLAHSMFWGVQDDLASLPTGGPDQSQVPMILTTWIPYSIWQALSISADPLQVAIMVPRVVMVVASLIIDVLIYRTFDFIGGEGAKPAVLCWASVWTSFVLLPRPSIFFVEAVCVALLLYASLGLVDKWMAMFLTLAVTYGVGVHVRTSFVGFFMLTFLHFFTLASRPSFAPKRIVPAFCVGTVVFFSIILAFGFIDSLYYGLLSVKLDGERIGLSTFLATTKRLGEMKLEGSLSFVPFNNLMKLKHFRQIREAYQAQLSQLFVTMPLMLGPLLIVLVQDAWEGTKKTYKELTSEMKNVSTGAGLGGAKKKKKKKKVPASAAKREDDILTFLDIIQTCFLLCLLLEVAVVSNEAGLISMISIMVPTAMMFGDRVFGPKKEVYVTISHAVYVVVGVVVFGMCINGGVSQIGKNLSRANVLPIVPAGSELTLFETSLPPKFFMGSNPHRVTLTELNTSLADLVEQLDLKAAEQDSLYVLAPGTAPLDSESSLEFVSSMKGHLSSSRPPGNADEIVTKNLLALYRYLPPAARFAESESAQKEPEADYEDEVDDREQEL